MKHFSITQKWVGIAVLIAIIGIILILVRSYITIRVVTDPYKDYSSIDTSISVISQDINLNVTNKYRIPTWQYSGYGLIYSIFQDRNKPYKAAMIYKTKEIVPLNVLDVPIEQRPTNDVKLRNSFLDNSVMDETYNQIPLQEGYRFSIMLKYDKKIKILSAFMNGEILKEVSEETDKYRYRLIYANQRKLAFCEDAKNLRKGVLYFYFERKGFIDTDIAIVQMKNEPKNIYFVYVFDENTGENHQTIKTFMKDYFDISLKE